jgi:DNA-binding transcriptional ArsR family regulator
MNQGVTENERNESAEESLFKTLSHQIRRDIIRVIGEEKEVTFSEIKKIVGITESPLLAYHLNALSFLLVQENGKYRLSDLGKETYNLLSKTTVSTTSTVLVRSLRKELPFVIVANAIFWASGLCAVTFFEGRPHQLTLFSFTVLWFFSTLLFYTMSKRIQ